MGYNKFIEEQKWLKWKEAEERQLRKLGVDEAIIKRLHEYDKEQFNEERRYREKQMAWSNYIDWYSAQFIELPVKDVKSLLDDIEDESLVSILGAMDRLTLQIILMKIFKYNGKEIAHSLGMDEYAVNMRIYRLRKKLKKYF